MKRQISASSVAFMMMLLESAMKTFFTSPLSSSHRMPLARATRSTRSPYPVCRAHALSSSATCLMVRMSPFTSSTGLISSLVSPYMRQNWQRFHEQLRVALIKRL